MAGHMSSTNQHLIVNDLYSNELSSLMLDDLYAMQFVNILTNFPHGYQFNIQSLGEATTADYNEGQAIKYNQLDTGTFPFAFTQYKYSANAISEKFKRDSMWASDVENAFVPRQHRALMEAVETRIFAVANSGQTASSLNTINNASHRWVASGTGQSITYDDFAKAQYALTKANVPLQRLSAVVDPSTAYTLQTQANVTNLLSPMQMAEDNLRNGTVTGFKYRFNIFGFDIYVSNYLPSGISETINSVAVTNGVANYFFAMPGGDRNPWIGAFRQQPTVYQEFNKDLQQTEYATFTEYDFKLRRPENMVTILTSTSVVPA